MTPGVWISLTVFAGTSVVAFVIAYLQRKQMRQIEMHRADPSVPLKPPPTALTKFLKRNLFILVLVPLNGFFLVHEVWIEKTPVTRYEVLNIALPVAGLLMVLLLHMQTRILDMMMTFDRDAWKAIIQVNKDISKIVDILYESTGAQVKAAEKSGSPPQASDSPQPKQLEAPKAQSGASETTPTKH